MQRLKVICTSKINKSFSSNQKRGFCQFLPRNYSTLVHSLTRIRAMVPSQELHTSDFVGVWQRTAIYEPKGTLGPDSDQRKMVLWVQTRSGLFIDIRYDPGLSYDPHLLKSFGGDVSFDQKSAHFTWHRAIDYRILVSS